MFYERSFFACSTLLDIPGTAHGFSSRRGGKSTLPHTATLNLSKELGDPDAVVCENFEIFARNLSNGAYGGGHTVTAHQIHSARVRILTSANAGEGCTKPCGEDGDGFVTDQAGVIPIVRTADCVPVLLAGQKPDGSPVVAAVHAGWRGTAAGICTEAVRTMLSLGCVLSDIRAAIGAHIGFCCYEVGEDFVDAVARVCGQDFATRHIRSVPDSTRLHADLTSMNLEMLTQAGVQRERIDVHPDCTMCMPEKYYSHRATGGKRGVMGAGICILP